MINYLGYTADQIRPRKDCILVKPDQPPRETRSASGLIYFPEKTRPIDGRWATVLAIPDAMESYGRCCPKCERPLDQYSDVLEVGDRVLMDSATAGDALIVDGEECRMVRLAELLAVEDRTCPIPTFCAA